MLASCKENSKDFKEPIERLIILKVLFSRRKQKLNSPVQILKLYYTKVNIELTDIGTFSTNYIELTSFHIKT
jgi:hypothetical protein